jgi:hypothetical protein
LTTRVRATHISIKKTLFSEEKKLARTKLKYILDGVKGILSVKEKIVIVSQWTAMLDLMATF